MSTDHLIYDWNKINYKNFPKIELCDETLRDGLQSPSVKDPHIEEKTRILSLLDELSVTIADIGLPGAGPRAYNDVLELAKFAVKNRLKIKLNCAARTLKQDIEPIARIQEQAGVAITAYCFLGTSPIRQLVENWDLEKLKRTTDEALTFAHKAGLATAFVTEDTVRSSPETLSVLFNHAINLGVERLVLCDTVGHATSEGVHALVNFTSNLIKNSHANVKIDWHGHNDRGLGLANAIEAAKAGCHRIHGTVLGVGERVGNTAIDQLIVNLKLLDAYPHCVEALVELVNLCAQATGMALPINYPVFGHDAFRTATGVHASAVIKAQNLHDEFLANTVYSGVPAHWFGKKQLIEIGPMSGASNVRQWGKQNNIELNEQNVQDILRFAKQQNATLSPTALKDFIKELA